MEDQIYNPEIVRLIITIKNEEFPVFIPDHSAPILSTFINNWWESLIFIDNPHSISTNRNNIRALNITDIGNMIGLKDDNLASMTLADPDMDFTELTTISPTDLII